MLRNARVWNDHYNDYSEEFKGDKLTVPAKDYIVMEEYDADLFLGQLTVVKRDAQGRDLIPKMLRKEIIIDEAEEPKLKDRYAPKVEKTPQVLICPFDSQRFISYTELNRHLAEKHLSDITSVIQKQKPGRPKKSEAQGDLPPEAA